MRPLEQPDVVVGEGQNKEMLMVGQEWEQRLEVEVMCDGDLLFEASWQSVGAEELRRAKDRQPFLPCLWAETARDRGHCVAPSRREVRF